MTLKSFTNRMGPLQTLGAMLAVTALLGGGGVLAASCGSGANPGPAGSGGPGAAGKGAGPGTELPGVPAGSTEVATPVAHTARYAAPGGRATGTVPASWHGRPSVLPVIAGRPGWVRVRLPSRPNGSTAWVKTDDVTLGTTPYRIVIDRRAMRLRLYNTGRLVFTAPAGVGAPDDPTPAGSFFLAFDEDPPRSAAGYGPFIMVTSAHSTSIRDWEGSGDAIVGIHGPLGEAREIGVTGARVSHGCVRLQTAALRRLRQVPPGTPVDITGLRRGPPLATMALATMVISSLTVRRRRTMHVHEADGTFTRNPRHRGPPIPR